MMDEMNRIPLTELDLDLKPEVQARKEAMLRDLESRESLEDRKLDRWEQAVAARQKSRQQEAQAKSVIRTRPLLLPPKPLSRARGRR